MVGLAVWFVQMAVSQTSPRQPSASAASELFEEPKWQEVCARAVAVPLPPAAAERAEAGAAERAPGSGQCDEQTLYYGFGKSPDYRAALQCAYFHRAHSNVRTNGSLDGAGTLAMLYANGGGVGRDYGLAIRFACEVGGGGGSNTAERIGRLEALRDGKLPAGTVFDLCDEQMSGAMGAYCSELEEKQGDARRAVRISKVEARLPPQAQAMLPALQAAESAFEQARIRGEYPGGGGSGSAGFALDDQNLLREQFVINLERFSRGEVPRASSASRQQAQEELNAAYATALAVPRDASASFGQPTIDGIRATQSAWQELFEEWMQVSAVAFPGLSQDGVAVELLRLRTHQLKRVAS